MGSLKDQLLKAGLVDKKKVRQVEHQKRVQRKVESAAQRAELEKQQQLKWEAQQEKKREKQRTLALQKLENKGKHQHLAQLRNIITQAMLQAKWSGPKRFHFVTRDQKISFLQVSEPVGKKLERGDLAIAEIPEHKGDPIVLISRQAALKVEKLDPNYLLFYNAAPAR